MEWNIIVKITWIKYNDNEFNKLLINKLKIIISISKFWYSLKWNINCKKKKKSLYEIYILYWSIFLVKDFFQYELENIVKEMKCRAYKNFYSKFKNEDYIWFIQVLENCWETLGNPKSYFSISEVSKINFEKIFYFFLFNGENIKIIKPLFL